MAPAQMVLFALVAGMSGVAGVAGVAGETHRPASSPVIPGLVTNPVSDASTSTATTTKVEVDWASAPVAVTPAVNSWHDTPAGASGNPHHDKVRSVPLTRARTDQL